MGKTAIPNILAGEGGRRQDVMLYPWIKPGTVHLSPEGDICVALQFVSKNSLHERCLMDWHVPVWKDGAEPLVRDDSINEEGVHRVEEVQQPVAPDGLLRLHHFTHGLLFMLTESEICAALAMLFLNFEVLCPKIFQSWASARIALSLPEEFVVIRPHDHHPGPVVEHRDGMEVPLDGQCSFNSAMRDSSKVPYVMPHMSKNVRVTRRHAWTGPDI